MQNTNEITIIAFYFFMKISDPQKLKFDLKENCTRNGLKGTVLIAQEGVNAMLAGSGESIEKFLSEFGDIPELPKISVKFTYSQTIPFQKLIVKVKPEIITLRQKGIDNDSPRAPHIKAEILRDWLKNKREILLLDTRNEFEIKAGKFKGAVDPEIKSFGQFPEFVLEKFLKFKDKKIVTYCTGGIRCEKATAYLLQAGFTDVYQLEGGILEFFDTLPQTDREEYFEGRLFVFDERVTI